MDTWLELVPPCIALVGIVITDTFFPEHMIESDLEEYRETLGEDYQEGLVNLVKLNIQGWQVTVDLLYTILASFALMICRVMTGHFERDRPVTWLLILLLFVNFVLSLVSGIAGPSAVASVPTKFLGKNLRQTSKIFCYTVNILLILAIAFEAIRYHA